MNVAHLIAWSAHRHAERLAFLQDDRTRSYAEVANRAGRFANALRGLGVAKGDRVGVLIANQIEYPEAEFGVTMSGAARVPMLTAATAAEMVRYVEFSEAVAVVASAECLPTLREALAKVSHPVKVIAMGGADAGEYDYEKLLAAAADTPPEIEIEETDLYAIRFTGGTTGVPKGVMMSHRAMVETINNMLLNWPIDGSDVALHIHPLSHASGMMMYVYWMRGASGVIRRAFNFEAEAFYRLVETHRITTLFIIPSVLNVLLDSPALGSFDCSSLRSVIYGGAPIPLTRLRQALAAFGAVFIQVYGTSEAPMLLTTLRREEHVYTGETPPARLASAGRPAYNVEVRVVDDGGRRCAPGELGEVVSRGPHTMLGYWKNAELSATRLRNGWVYTGDIGYLDDEGYLHIVDRKEDMIITGGFNVWPAEIEDVIYGHPAIHEAAVFGVQDERWGEAVCAVAIPKHGEALNENSFRAYLEARDQVQGAEDNPVSRRAHPEKRSRQTAAQESPRGTPGRSAAGTQRHALTETSPWPCPPCRSPRQAAAIL